MYQFSGRLKTLAIAFMVLGALGVALGFYNAPKTLEDAKEIMANQSAHGAHGNDHGETKHVEETHTEKKEDAHAEDNHSEENSHSEVIVEEVHGDSHSEGESHSEEVIEVKEVDEVHAEKLDTHASDNAHGTSHDDAHAEHVFHQLQNRPWAALYVALIFFLGVTLLVLAFYAIQRVAQAGWSIVLFRVMEAITANLLPVSLILIAVLVASFMHMNHLFSWMTEGTFTPGHENYDPIVDGKSGWINAPWWMIRSVFYLFVWNAYRWFIRRNSIKEDTAENISTYKKNYNVSVIFLFLFMITESMAVWDWIMGLDPHWFSTLFGWYVLATFLVSAVTTITFVTIYLRSKGYLPKVNDSHIHDLAKFMFGFSVFWTYLWFAQFMLIWYADIPEETTYYAMRFNEYKGLFLGMVVMNFVFPILLLINSDFKSIPWFVVMGGIVILAGHYVDVFVMIMPATVGAQWAIGIPEIGAILFFLGLLIWTTFSAFAKADPVAKGNPFLGESEHFHYYNIEHRGEDADAHH
ncbi:quinol:cytochrome C oxidoreductase [Tenacibaculum todarodis]|uniref:Quinol:cytochrome C oxidoreductase n=1 Tax=Tenacibaculum todarodis TaxID=1850252 RepID=A0A1L3JM13_9FLAO|nr:quinol:cytochrome C oxidoreductase [Tenacibaculum todarodis]APG66190.1 quinol:cytochrome C oxidoreductase [Tenacibaculum todarodis]